MSVRTEVTQFDIKVHHELGSDILKYCSTKDIFNFISRSPNLYRIYHNSFLDIVLSRHISKCHYVSCDFIINLENKLSGNDALINNLKEKITSLSIPREFDNGIEKAKKIFFSVCEKLERVEIKLIGMIDGLEFSSSLKDFKAPEDISDEILEKIVKQCPKLEFIDLMFCKKITDKSIKVVANSYSSLISIDISRSQVGDEGIKAIFENCSSLTTSHMSFCNNITAEGLKALKASHSLTSISLGGPAVQDEVLKAFVEKYSSLKVIQLSIGSEITDEGLHTLIQGYPSFEYLELIGCSHITDEGIHKLLKNYPSLYLQKERRNIKFYSKSPWTK